MGRRRKKGAGKGPNEAGEEPVAGGSSDAPDGDASGHDGAPERDDAPEDVSPPRAPDTGGSMAEALLPAALLRSGVWRRFEAWPVERRELGLVGGLAALLFLPFLGSVGLWDPWETHYAEVARSMIVRSDYVHPYWEHAYFFSKPVLSFWLMALGMQVVDALDGPRGAMSIYTEWSVRLPFALIAIGGMLATYLGVARTLGRRVGVLAAVALGTMPLYFFLARQAMTDMPFVGLTGSAMFCFMVAVFGGEEDEEPNAAWLYAFYVLSGFGVLAKGLLGVALPGAVILAFIATTGRWGLLARLRIPSGALVGLLIAAPWYVVMSLFGGKDDEFKTFAYRFFVHDHFKRIATGVHTTTPGGTFTYFIEQLGFGTFPWVAAIPGGLAVAGRELGDGFRTKRQQALLFVLLWAVIGYVVFSLSATKFHHYGFPIVPPLAVLCALFLSTLWDEGLSRHVVVLLVGLVLFVVVAQNLTLQPKHLADLFVYNYERPYPGREVDPRRLFAAAFSIAGAGLAAGWLWKSRRTLVGVFLAFALAFSLYGGWVHWVKLSHHWSQRDLFWTYYQDRTDDEPIAAYYMNWRGETFYSQNSVKQIKDASKLRDFVKEPGPEYVLVEQGRHKGMQSVLSGYRVRILDRSNNKYFLVRVDDR